ncbi:pyruvate kinase [Kallipyga gabonensis]|uniref:pyruvate kinase n=1 Tax=Kallipyga gabonensis TaxID=1686287 RepID=UPI00093F69A9|nr:pyruvate kinase [Kallipyga gabonensis]
MIEIYGTLGPACAQVSCLKEMILAGMTGIRLNLSHTGLAQAEPWIRVLHEAEREAGRRVSLLVDLQGPELRTGIRSQPLPLEKGQVLPLYFSGDSPAREDEADGPVLPNECKDFLRPGQEIRVDDGKILLEVLPGEGRLMARVRQAGLLGGRKSLALPGCRVPMPALTQADRENMSLFSDMRVGEVMLPFVRSAQDLVDLREALDRSGNPEVRILAKLENRQGLDALDDLIPLADTMVIARGDLGTALPLWELPWVQKKVAEKCRQAGRPFMVVTQMLDSMMTRPLPTRAEVSDIANAVWDGASAVMITGETAAGNYPVEAMDYLVKTVRFAENHLTRR